MARPHPFPPPWGRALSLSRLYDHAQIHHSRKDSSGRVISPSQRPLPDNTQHSQQTEIHASHSSEFEPRTSSKVSTVDPRIRPRGHLDRPKSFTTLVRSCASYERIDTWNCFANRRLTNTMLKRIATAAIPTIVCTYRQHEMWQMDSAGWR